jgi:hypothetical protein
MASSTVIVPQFVTDDADIHFFTARLEDYPVIDEFMKKYVLTYGRFFASFINHGKTSTPL